MKMLEGSGDLWVHLQTVQFDKLCVLKGPNLTRKPDMKAKREISIIKMQSEKIQKKKRKTVDVETREDKQVQDKIYAREGARDIFET